MTASSQTESTNAHGPADGWWHDAYEDIFASAADTTKQPRPRRFDPDGSLAEAELPLATAQAAEPPPLPPPLPPPSVRALRPARVQPHTTPPLPPTPAGPPRTTPPALTAVQGGGLSPMPGWVPCVADTKVVRILLADDDKVLQHILGYQLAHLEWKVTCSGDGAEVEQLLHDGQVDVLLIDLNLPHRNAYEILEHLQGTPGGPRVIVMSEQVQEDKVVRAFKLGADDFVQKPFNPRVVMSRILRLMHRE